MLDRQFTPALLILCTGLAAQDPQTALARLRAGNEAFVRGEPIAPQDSAGWRRTLAAGARPWAAVVTCADSRTAPEILFQTEPGDLVVVRNAGAVCDPETLGSIKHAVGELGVRFVLFVTHSDCGAVAARLAGGDGSPTLRHHLERLERARLVAVRDGRHGAELAPATEREAAQQAIATALAQSRLLRERVRSGELKLRGARCDLGTGEIEWLPDRGHALEPEAGPPPHRGQQVLGMPPQLAVQLLRAGQARAASGARAMPDLSEATRQRLAQGQRPHAVVLTDSDPRVVPERIFDAGLGELFVVRVAGAAASDAAIASVEYALDHCGASAVVVLVTDTMAPLQALARHDPAPTPAMQQVLDHLAPAVAQARGEGMHGDRLLERASELQAFSTAASLRARSELVRDLEQRGRAVLLPARYQIASGDVTWLAPGMATPAPATPPAPVHEPAPLPAPVHTPAPAPTPADAAAPAPAPSSPSSQLLLALLAAFLFSGTLVTSSIVLHRCRAPAA